MGDNNVKIRIDVDSKTGEARVSALGDKFDGMGRKGHSGISKISTGLRGLKTYLMITTPMITAMGGAFLTWKLGQMAKDFTDTASNMDKLRLSLDTITKGHGDEWFEKLNTWALKMPVNTEKAIASFSMLRAMGLQPTIKDMTTLVDTSSALGGDAGTLEGIARALGQIKTKGKVSAEELMQLAERGIPAYEILKEKLGLTSAQVANIGKMAISGDVAVQALLEGMEERFGGMSAKMQTEWGGMTESLKSYYTEFQRLTMASGPMDAMKSGLNELILKLDQMKKTGELDKWAASMARGVLTAFQSMAVGAQILHNVVRGLQMSMAKVAQWYYEIKAWDTKNAYQATGDVESLRKSQRYSADAQAWGEVSQDRMTQIHDVNQAMDDLINKLSQYKYASTDTAQTVIKNDVDVANNKTVAVNQMSEDIKREMTSLEQLSAQTASTMSNSFSTMFIDAMKGEFKGFEAYASDMLQSILQQANNMLAQMATEKLFGSGGSGGGGGGWIGTAVSLIGGLLGEKGLAFNTAGVSYMAKGGVFNRPFAVPMVNGGVAVGSEYGQDEAIMPLTRTSSGHLGVRAQTQGAGNQKITHNYNTYEIKAIDAKSFTELCERTPNAITKPLNAEIQGGNRELIKNLKAVK